MINELLNLSQGMMNANAMQNAATQNQAYAQSQMAALSNVYQASVYGANILRPSASVQPSEHERKLLEAEDHLEAIKAAGAVRRHDIIERVFAPGSPYRGEAS